MKFIADAMLGRLARWLRFLGFDTLYYPRINDSRLIKIAKEEERFILTRDTRLVKSKAVKDYVLIAANDPFEQLIEVLNSLKVRQIDLLSRCVTCNGRLVDIVNKAEIRDSVPEYVFLHYNDFLKCEDCGKIYWKGSHPKKFKEKVGKILEALDNDGS